ncbi:hypothetical protein EYF80_042406 [Liparis tanakae]|uniref:Uncharacterized protein n=1 Tax=Liparis tanakae TaxID=230148 RepID=A0A4Z2G3G4_9TELE|nr:hypothetical protein EYF80_042406 [Liparis tanakae]
MCRRRVFSRSYRRPDEDPPGRRVEVTPRSQSFSGVPDPDRGRLVTAQGSISSLRVAFDSETISCRSVKLAPLLPHACSGSLSLRLNACWIHYSLKPVGRALLTPGGPASLRHAHFASVYPREKGFSSTSYIDPEQQETESAEVGGEQVWLQSVEPVSQLSAGAQQQPLHRLPRRLQTLASLRGLAATFCRGTW